MNIVQVIEKYSPIGHNLYNCSNHEVKVMRAEYENGEVEFASLFCCDCSYSYRYTDFDAYKTMEKSVITRCYDVIKSWIS